MSRFASEIDGIPCIIEVLCFQRYAGGNHSSQEDYNGGVEFDYSVLDINGYPARWLERKITHEIESRLIAEYENG